MVNLQDTGVPFLGKTSWETPWPITLLVIIAEQEVASLSFFYP